MTINLGYYNGEKNKVNKTENISWGWSQSAELRDGTNITNPSILIKASPDTVCGYNYAYIPEFKRWYYITDCGSFRNSLTEINLAVDVLMTFKESIKSSPVILTRSSKAGDGDLALPDNRFPVKQSEVTHTILFNTLYDDSGDAGKGQTMILVLTGIDE